MVTHPDTQKIAHATLEAAIASARAGFVCMFSSADEYENALISERRAQGRYRRLNHLPLALFIGLSLVVAGAALLLV